MLRLALIISIVTAIASLTPAGTTGYWITSSGSGDETVAD